MTVTFGKATRIENKDVPGANIQPQFVNRFQVVASPGLVRIIFGDAVVGTEATYHSSIVMSAGDAKELGDLLRGLLEKTSDPVPEKG